MNQKEDTIFKMLHQNDIISSTAWKPRIVEILESISKVYTRFYSMYFEPATFEVLKKIILLTFDFNIASERQCDYLPVYVSIVIYLVLFCL